jgi:hypothetical protein
MFYWDEDKYPLGTVDTPARWGVVMLDDTYSLGPVYKLAMPWFLRVRHHARCCSRTCKAVPPPGVL